MQAYERLSKKEIAGGIGIAALFLLASFGSEQIAALVESYVETGGILGMLFYVLTVIIIVLIPLASTLPIIPIAVALWGNVLTACLTLIGWLVSSSAAFFIARRYGQRYFRRFKFFGAITHFANMMPVSNLWWGILFLGMLGAPVDIMSYTVGIFSNIRLRQYILAIGIGMIPFAFFITYTATLPIIYQTYIIGFMLVTWFVVYTRLRKKSVGNSEYSQEPRVDKPQDSGSTHRPRIM